MGPVEAIRSTGGTPLQVMVYAVLPQVKVAWTGISIYSWDSAFRAATVLGYFGAGGMGWYLKQTIETLDNLRVSAILLSIIMTEGIPAESVREAEGNIGARKSCEW